jgi:putative phage-type endonuclease
MSTDLSVLKPGVVRASDVSTILGLNPYKTVLELWGEYTGVIKREQFEDPLHPTNIGRIMEAPIADLYAAKTGRKLRRATGTFTNAAAPWLEGHLDRVVVGEKRGVEIKNVGFRAARGWGADGGEIAEHYLPQPMTYMLLTGFKVFDVCAYFGGDDVRTYTIERDSEWDTLILSATRDFMDHHVIPRVPPPASGERDLMTLRRIYPGTNGQTIAATTDIDAWLRVLDDANKLANRYASVVAEAKAHVLEFMGEAAVLQSSAGTFTRKVVKRSGYVVDPTSYTEGRWKAMKEE